MMRTITFLGALLCSFTSESFSQNSIDSLAGFDEQAALRASVSDDFTGQELRIHMQQLKRNYINTKFSLIKEPVLNYFDPSKTMVAACVNEDFEASTAGVITSSTQIAGWTITRGLNTNGNNNCNLTGCCLSNPNESSLITAANGYTDPVIGSIYPIYSVFGTTPSNTNAAVVNPQITSGMFGTNFIRLNSNVSNYSMERISKTFSVTASNALFKFAFITVQSTGHSCCDAGGFILRITNVTSNTFLSALSYSASGVSSSCTSSVGVTYLAVGSGTPPGSSTFLTFNKWHVNYADLSPYLGQNINIEVTTGDCTAGGHFAYAYFDAQCGPMDLQVNGAPNNLSCSNTATVSAPANLNAYNWTGPNNFTSSSQSFTTTTVGVYSLTIPQNSPYLALEKTLTLVISPASVTLSATKETICKGEKTVLQGSGLSNYIWSGGGSASSKTVQPSTTTTYTLTGTNSDNCPGFAMITVSVNACTGILVQSEAEAINVFPNPNQGEFELSIPHLKQSAELIITSNLGHVVHTQTVYKGVTKIKTKGLAPGIYYYSVLEEGTLLSQGKLTLND